MKNNVFNQTAPLIFYGWDPMRVQETPPPPIPPPFQCWNITKSSDIQQGYRERDHGRC